MAAYIKDGGDKILKLYAKHFLCKGNIIYQIWLLILKHLTLVFVCPFALKTNIKLPLNVKPTKYRFTSSMIKK